MASNEYTWTYRPKPLSQMTALDLLAHLIVTVPGLAEDDEGLRELATFDRDSLIDAARSYAPVPSLSHP